MESSSTVAEDRRNHEVIRGAAGGGKRDLRLQDLGRSGAGVVVARDLRERTWSAGPNGKDRIVETGQSVRSHGGSAGWRQAVPDAVGNAAIGGASGRAEGRRISMATGVDRSEDRVDAVAVGGGRGRNNRGVGPVIVGWRDAGEIEPEGECSTGSARACVGHHQEISGSTRHVKSDKGFRGRSRNRGIVASDGRETSCRACPNRKDGVVGAVSRVGHHSSACRGDKFEPSAPGLAAERGSAWGACRRRVREPASVCRELNRILRDSEGSAAGIGSIGKIVVGARGRLRDEQALRLARASSSRIGDGDRRRAGCGEVRGGNRSQQLGSANKRREARVVVQIHHRSQDVIVAVHGEREGGPAGRNDFGRDRVDGGDYASAGHGNVNLCNRSVREREF